jgi:hypothetical protein
LHASCTNTDKPTELPLPVSRGCADGFAALQNTNFGPFGFPACFVGNLGSPVATEPFGTAASQPPQVLGRWSAASPRHCERSEAIHLSVRGVTMDCFAAPAMTWI